jgi:serine/threonine protein kinase
VKPENIFISLDHLTPSPTSRDAPSATPDCDASTNVAAEGTPKCSTSKNIENSKIRSVIERGDCSGNESTDSGHASGCDARFYVETSSNVGSSNNGVDERISYKIGDLGHVVPIYGDHIPEEGDCRYMAPELLADDIDREKLAKADVFSLGLTLYEAASLQELPKNSLEDSMYERIKSGDLPFVEGYSKEFNQLLKVNYSCHLQRKTLEVSILVVKCIKCS